MKNFILAALTVLSLGAGIAHAETAHQSAVATSAWTLGGGGN